MLSTVNAQKYLKKALDFERICRNVYFYGQTQVFSSTALLKNKIPFIFNGSQIFFDFDGKSDRQISKKEILPASSPAFCIIPQARGFPISGLSIGQGDAGDCEDNFPKRMPAKPARRDKDGQFEKNEWPAAPQPATHGCLFRSEELLAIEQNLQKGQTPLLSMPMK
jgi:hypothetical protein